ncbi:MAG: MBL fold metallo-hydrolase [Eubacteriales bacterium]|nr:MBL fold metallo-hydrolase [Eubacteriales bacterium]
MKKLYRWIYPVIVLSFLLSGCDVETNEVNNDIQSQVRESVINHEDSRDISESQTETQTEYEIIEATTEISPQPNLNSKLMYAHFIDVGQADSTFIELSNGQTMLIDAGRKGDSETIINYIRNLQYDVIDFVIATHPHDDHIGGMADVLNSFEIGKMYMPRQAHTISAFDNMLDVIENKGIELYTAKAGVNITRDGNTIIDILAPFADSYTDLNNCSAIVKLTYGKTVMIFTGDSEKEIELQRSDVDAEVLKVGHHGSNSSSAPKFIEAVSPAVAVISVGYGNSYGHPHEETLSTLSDIGAEIYRTDEVGTITITADSNKKIVVNKKSSSIKENAPPITEEAQGNIRDESVNEETQNFVVYRTKTGTKYHRLGCSYLKSKIETTISEAEAMGLGPCSRCCK